MGILEKKYNAIKKLVLSSNGISRIEISEALHFDLRTVTRHLEDMVNRGFLVVQKEEKAVRGRPRTLYYPNFENICFLGLFISSNFVRGSIIDYYGNELVGYGLETSLKNESKLSFYNKVLNQCSILLNQIKMLKKEVGGIGIAVSRWLQPPLSSYDILPYLYDDIVGKFSISIYRETPINSLLYKIKNNSLELKDIAIVHAGDVLELGIILDNKIPENMVDIEHEFQHITVASKGKKCFCGKHGCLENETVTGEVLNNYNTLYNKQSVNSINEVYEMVKLGDKDAIKVVDNAAKYMAKGLVELSERYKLTDIYFCDTNGIFYDIIKKHLNEEFVFHRYLLEKKSVPRAAGNMAGYLTIKHHLLK